jgi:uncharacterized protein YbcV (DUF1398 family)
MNTIARNAVLDCTRFSDDERETFGQIVGRLMAAGIERYHADLRRAEKVYYTSDGESLAVPAAPVAGGFAETFSAAGVDAAVRAAQAGAIKYQEFCERIAAAGCVGYHVSLAGRRAVYYGRSGETHVEPFPPAK